MIEPASADKMPHPIKVTKTLKCTHKSNRVFVLDAAINTFTEFYDSDDEISDSKTGFYTPNRLKGRTEEFDETRSQSNSVTSNTMFPRPTPMVRSLAHCFNTMCFN